MDCSPKIGRKRKSRCRSCQLPPGRQKNLLGICLIAAGVLVMLLFVPAWLIAIVLAFLLFSLGFWLLACR